MVNVDEVQGLSHQACYIFPLIFIFILLLYFLWFRSIWTGPWWRTNKLDPC